MKNDNLIFLTDEELDKNIYRVFSFKRLKEIFDTKKVTLVKPKRWNDPFENFILNSTGILPDGREFQIGFMDSVGHLPKKVTQCGESIRRIKMESKSKRLFENYSTLYFK
jgi:hypothetical protein|tara:strand:- start:104 stop:433 length:330 start_codon:yes stop_codon:yes gene_type:complete